MLNPISLDNFSLLMLQFLLSLVVYSLVSKWYVWPRLTEMSLNSALVPLVFVHAMRHLGMTFLVPVVVDPNIPKVWASQVAYGDLLAMLLALLSIFALRLKWRIAIPVVWVFNVVGFLDLANAFIKGAQFNVANFQLGAAWYIPTFVVPLLLVTHVMIFLILTRAKSWK